MWDRRLASDSSLYSSAGYDPRWAVVAPRLVGHRFQNVPVAAGTAKYPVVITSHGLPAFRKLGSHSNENLASHGYIVVAVDHPDCWATEFPDGRYLAGNYAGDVPARLRVSESAVKSMIHRMRQRHRELLREEIAQTVPSVTDIDDELRHLVSVLRGTEC